MSLQRARAIVIYSFRKAQLLHGSFYEANATKFSLVILIKMIMERSERLEQLHKLMIEEVQDFAIVLLDLDGTILTWNKGVEKIKGYKAHEIIGQNFNIFYLPQDRQEKLPQKLIDLAKREGRAKHIGRRVRKDGSIFWGSILITALHDDNQNVVGFTKLTRELRDNEID